MLQPGLGLMDMLACCDDRQTMTPWYNYWDDGARDLLWGISPTLACSGAAAMVHNMASVV
jgi:hypothetical protein